jgi:ATP-dependent RNA helicase DBP3
MTAVVVSHPKESATNSTTSLCRFGDKKLEQATIVKVAKRIFQEEEEKKKSIIKVKSLSKKVVKNLAAQSLVATKESIVETIKESTEFRLCEKRKAIISLASPSSNSEKTNVKKRKQDSDSDDVDMNNPEKKQDRLQQWRQKHKIIVFDSANNKDTDDKGILFEPSYTFHDAFQTIAAPLINYCIQGKQYETPSPIQAQCWPILSSTQQQRRDLIGIAETGSGKTLAFALPALSLLSSLSSTQKKARLPQMLVLAPTRELAIQSHEVIAEFGKCVGITSLVVYGGVSKHTQATPLRQGQIDCVVATPGRLKDLIQDSTCDLSNISYLVLDEADRMLDMGFQEDVEFIIRQCPASTATTSGTRRQTCMLSATWPSAIQQMAAHYMVSPVRVYVGFEPSVAGSGESLTTAANPDLVEDSLSANKRVRQIVEVIEDRAREGRLKQLLQEYTTTRNSSSNKNKGKGKDTNMDQTLEHDRILVFALYKKEADRLERIVRQWGYEVGSIHGNKSQEARSKSLNAFKDGSCPLLIATDVASRGLDIPNVEVVLNYTFPLTIEDYVHRIGRTGRAGKNGLAHTFFQPTDKGHAGELQQVILQAGQDVPPELMKFGSTIKKKEHKLYGAHYNKGSSSTMPMKQPTRIKFDD